MLDGSGPGASFHAPLRDVERAFDQANAPEAGAGGDV